MMVALLTSMVFVTVALLVYGLFATVFSDEVTVRKSLKRLDAYEVEDLYVAQPVAKPFFDRVILPFYGRLSSIVRRISPKEIEEQIKIKLIRAGSPKGMDVDRFLSLKALSAITAAALILVLLLIKGLSPSIVLLGLILVPASYFLPNLWLKSVIETRQKQIRLALPDTLDLLTISVEAGLGFDLALAKVVKNHPGPLAEEFSRTLHEVQVGVSRKDALKNLAERTDVDELRNFIMSIIQADIFGVSIGNVLRVQASEMRLKRKQRAEEIAQKAPVKIVFPLILCIFPSIFVVIIGPGVIRIITSLMGRF
ncbi:MAG: type II secretion system F family protein [Actinobacteria bacterium]|nr:type II secretion system F family protein [Actinomycetota bacterium]